MNHKPTIGNRVIERIMRVGLLGVFILIILLTIITVPVRWPGFIPAKLGAYLDNWTARTIFIPDKVLARMLDVELPSQDKLSPAGVNEAQTPSGEETPAASAAIEKPDSTLPPKQTANPQNEAGKAGNSAVPTGGSSPEASSQWVQVSDKTPVRNEAKATSPEITTVAAGAWLPVLKQDGQWIKVKLGEEQAGWLDGRKAQLSKAPNQPQILRFASASPLYSGPDDSFARIGLAEEDSAYLPKQVSGQWIELVEKNAQGSLWVQADKAAWTYGQPNAAAPASVNISSSSPEKEAQGKLAGKTIVLDPGHGGTDTGAIAKNIEVYERDINLSAAIVLRNKLQAAGARVIMTRTTNEEAVSLEKRADTSNRNHADLFISIHQNIFEEDPNVAGAITFYNNKNSLQAARLIEEEIVGSIGENNAKQKVENKPFVVLRDNEQPAVLVEGCFLSNPGELGNSLLSTFHEKLAAGIYKGVLKFFEK